MTDVFHESELTIGIVGLGLIGSSIGLGMTRAGAQVLGFDRDPQRRDEARGVGAVHRLVDDFDGLAACNLVVVCVPVSSVADAALAVLAATEAFVTDVGSVKHPVVEAIENAGSGLAERFVGGHPMAGSEQSGPLGATPNMFRGAAWVLTPTASTDAVAFSAVRAMVQLLGAEPIEIAPGRHDQLVAAVSHVPHLTAGALLEVAHRDPADHALTLRLAAGGFRDMTRIASGDPEIWPDICFENDEAIVDALDALIAKMQELRQRVANADRAGLLADLNEARFARSELMNVQPRSIAPLVSVRIPVPDRPGVLAEITTSLGARNVNVFDLEIAHSVETHGGLLIMLISEQDTGAVAEELTERGYVFTFARQL